jgi:cytochrome c-type biogenesis protein CcmH/NrfF
MDTLILLQSSPFPSISGIVLCFFPLALVIVGFIVAARFTDKAATSSYLRLDPKSANEE